MKLIGNDDIQNQLTLARFSAKEDDRPLPHTLFSGAAGCGKTSTARSIARESGSLFVSVAPESIKTRDDVLNIFDQFDKKEGYDKYGDRIKEIKIPFPILFIDEIHRLPITGQEHLGIAMEEWVIALDVSQVKAKSYDKFGIRSKERSRWIPYFALMGATTNDGLLSKPFKDRFKLRFLFNTYSLEESIEIVKVHADRLKVSIDDGGALEVAQRGRGVPRILVSLLERCKDFVISINTRHITAEYSKYTFTLMKVDSTGLTEVDIKILLALYKSKDHPLGVDNMAIIVNESKQAISETIEPYLIQRGLITGTSRGRALTEPGKEYLISKGLIDEGDEEDWVDIRNDYVRRQ